MTIGGRLCLLHECGVPQVLLVQLTARHEEKNRDQELALLEKTCGHGFVFLALVLDDWVADLMPWHDDAVTRKTQGESRASHTLYYIQHTLLPWATQAYGPLPCVLGGYSLGGLFALWASALADDFKGVAAVSPSVWIEGWDAFASSRPSMARVVYLSLGLREERARNRRMAAVGPCVRRQHERLVGSLGEGHCVLEWNAGGHFDHEAERMARGFAWIVRRLLTINEGFLRY